jgi:acyl carrier protein
MNGEPDRWGGTVEAGVTAAVAATLAMNRRSSKIDDALPALRSTLDSYALLELVLRLEETFGIRIEDDELDPDHFESIRTLTSFISGKAGGDA